MTFLVTLFNALFVGLATALYISYLKRHKHIASLGYAPSFRCMFWGISVITGAYLTHAATANALIFLDHSTTLYSAAKLINKYVIWGSFFIAGPLIFGGLAMLINLLIPNASRQITQMKEESEQLNISHNILSQELSERNSELEASNHKLRQALKDQQTSRIALLQSEKKFRTLYDENPTVFASVNSHRTLSDINLHGAQLLGFDPIQLVGKAFTKIVSAKDLLAAQKYLDSFFIDGVQTNETELRLLRADKTEIWVKISGSLVREADTPLYLLLVCQDISTLKNLQQELTFYAKHDSLTGLLNRYALEEHLKEILQNRNASGNEKLAFIYIDVDQLKVVNDTCGHRAGDELIKQLSTIFQENLQDCDCFARVGGDEFAVIKNNATRESAIELAEIVRNAAEDFIFVWESQSFRLSVSVGVTLSSTDVRTSAGIFGAADAACFTAKEAGRNRVVFLENPEASTDNRTEMLWVSRLQEALQKDRFELYFQPIMHLGHHRKRHIHYEMLIRYVNDDGSHLGPDAFLPAADRFGLSEQVDLWVLTTALDYLSRHPEHTKRLSCCSINITSHSLASHITRSAILQLISEIDFPTSKICFEITESSAIRNLAEAVEFIKELKILGCKFALDDFGTGFSSFGYLKNLDVDYVKIDGSFVKDVVVDGIDRAIVNAINNIGMEMGIDIVAEYVESDTITKELVEMNVHYGQGFGLSKPMPITEIEDYYNLVHST